MKTHSRIISVLNTTALDSTITGIKSFELSDLKLSGVPDLQLPTNLRLGHLAERVVSELIKSSSNFIVRYENVQIMDAKKTIGEIDFIIEQTNSRALIHMELAYKFYLYDPTISTIQLANWIGPNRNDSLQEKLEKLKTKQFPLLRNELLKPMIYGIDLEQITQSLCLLVSLFLPYEFIGELNPLYKKAVKGYYLDFKKFVSLNNCKKNYHLPSKIEWGIDPSENEIWTDFNEIENQIKNQIDENQAVLCWQELNGSFSSFFIVWW